jgi:dipeptidyl aminopeptidase/acylaminoacyl peptidase
MKPITVGLAVLVGGTLLTAAAPDPIVARRPLNLSPQAARDTADLLRHVKIEAITYMSDGLRINGYLAVPDGPGPFPSVISNRGGSIRLGVLTDEVAARSLGKLASWGYVAVASQYRGAAGSEGHDDYGGGDVDDVLNLLPVLDSVPVADHARIGMHGGSRGGMMTYLALTRTDRIRAAVVLSGMSDLFENSRSRPEMARNFEEFMPDYAADPEAALARRSAIRWPEKLPPNVPLLLIHGTADWRVAPGEAFDMARALYAAKRPMRLVMYEGGSHGVPEFEAERDALERGWLDSYVRDGRKWPDLAPHGS